MSVEQEIAQVMHIAHTYHDALVRGAAQPLTAQATLDAKQTYDALVRAIHALAFDAVKYRQLNTPEIKGFLTAVEREALHQRERWAASGDAGKSDADWFWLLGYLGGKALHAGGAEKSAAAVGNSPMARQYYEKQLHHIITTAAACLNWHAARVGTYQDMRPGIDAAISTKDKP